MAEILLEVDAVSAAYGNIRALQDVSLKVPQGAIVALLGANGAGKSTTLNVISRLVSPTAGSVRFAGEPIHRLSADAVVGRGIVQVPEGREIFREMSVRENLELIAEIYGMNRREASEMAEKMLRDFSLTERARDRAKKLSGGMQRRLSIAMALISNPRVLFLDEPTLGLDVRARRDLWKHVEALKGRMTIVLTTHYLEEAEALSDRIGIMNKGRLVALGTAEEIVRETGKLSFEEAFLSLTDEEEEA